MIYYAFERVMSAPRMTRYLVACGNKSRKAMTLYRLNLRLSQEFLTVISCLEVGLRNSIDRVYLNQLGAQWLRVAASPGGVFDNVHCRKTATIINDAVHRLGARYTHNKLVAEMDFGMWRYLFARPQFAAAGRTLLSVFPAKPRSTSLVQYNSSYVFGELAKINDLRNRIAHHEPICFQAGLQVKDTTQIGNVYGLIIQLFQWMQVDESALLYGIDHVVPLCDRIDRL
jgi:hypothetical protein